MDADQLPLRKMTFEGIPYDHDWLVMWRGLNIGRILKQVRRDHGRPELVLGHQHLRNAAAGSLEGQRHRPCDCQRQFNAAWATVRAPA